MANKSKIFVRGSAREKQFDNGGRVINASIHVDDMAAYKNDKGYAPIVIASRAEEDDYGNTHYIYIDEYSLNRQKEREAENAEGPKGDGETRANPFRN